jgi:hyperosmotically inducible protein
MKKILLIIGLLFMVSGCVNNNTMGESKVGTFLSDTALTARVKTALVDQRGLEGLDIHVNSYKGVVQLSGFVDTDVEKELAGQIARNVDDVVDVVNNIIVKP